MKKDLFPGYWDTAVGGHVSYGEKIEEAIVESKAYDANGKQLGTPHPHRLIRRGGGRWYVADYAPRF